MKKKQKRKTKEEKERKVHRLEKKEILDEERKKVRESYAHKREIDKKNNK